MELRMKDICEGRKNKLEVVQESLDQYRDVYLRVQQKLPVLHAVSKIGGVMMISSTDCS
jgi:DNA topoisomerase-3